MKSYIDYLLLLLPAPLKRAKRATNFFAMLCRFAGTLFDEAMERLHLAREQTKLLSCAPELLAEHGRDRGVPQLEGESADGYRDRLVAQFDVAQRAGTAEGIKLAIESLGYRKVLLEPVSKKNPSRWAEFFVWIGGTAQQVAVDITLLEREIGKVKRATSRAAYGVAPSKAAVAGNAFCCIGIRLAIEPLTVKDMELQPSESQLSAAINSAITVIIDFKGD